ncbi:hypothetical protein [Methylorubrum extorquens]|uniref:hypothetical protein n=1 Tax=Methylorubrum extorquens TaxID=408 RepID=UPI0020A08378|nr:hypothetical protein [Methylorubrum extorquens]MCP1540073.1 hypothetical protein [Methylorubrum extorquens]
MSLDTINFDAGDALGFATLPGERVRAFEAPETLIERIESPAPRFSLIDQMFVERGTKADWDLLHDLHYKAENLSIGPRFWKLTLDGQTIGVLVTANPKGLLKERHVAFPKIKPGGGDTVITNTDRYLFINQNFRVISRFVIDTMFRGIGAGYRMMNLVSRLEGNRIMEIQSSMSKFNHFGQKAGFRFVKPMNANRFDKGLKFFRSHFESSPGDFEGMVEELARLPAEQAEVIVADARAFYYRHSALEKTGNNRGKGRERVAAMTPREVLKSIAQMTLASPLYGVWMNPDHGREMPERLPLSAFDWQKPTEKLKVPFDA